MFLSLLILPSLAAQCPETISITGNGQLKMKFSQVPNPIPTSVTYNGIEYPISQLGNSGNFRTERNTFSEDDLEISITFNYEVSSYNCSFSTFGELNQRLPVEFISYGGLLDHDDIHLFWRTAKEEDNAGFKIEHSFDGTSFTVIGSMVSTGYSETVQDYKFIDVGVRKKALNSTSYYRISQFDFDGQVAYTEVIAVDLNLNLKEFEITKITGWDSSERVIKVYFYNPYDVRKVNVLVSDIQGNVIDFKSIYPVTGVNVFEINLSFKESYLYFVSLNNGKEIIGEKVVLGSDY